MATLAGSSRLILLALFFSGVLLQGTIGAVRQSRASSSSRRAAGQQQSSFGIGGNGAPVSPAWPWQPMTINIPIPRESAGSSVPLVILPLPVPVPAAPQQTNTECKVSQEDNSQKIHFEDGINDFSSFVRAPPSLPVPSRRPTPAAPRPPQFSAPSAPAPAAPVPPPQYPSYVRPEELDQTVTAPRLQTIYTSDQLVQLFRQQTPSAPELPPVLLSEHDRSERNQVSDESVNFVPTLQQEQPAPTTTPSRGRSLQQQSHGRGRNPSPPRMTRSLMISGELTVPRADYTESYIAWWDVTTGAARVEYYGGSTATYRTIKSDGKIQQLEMRVDRSSGSVVRRCGKTEPEPAAWPAARAAPGLPDLSLFSFGGYEQFGEEKLEKWTFTLSGRVGEHGAAQGEALTFRHEMLLTRADDDNIKPIRYTVAVDSSVLGPDCEGYQHRYMLVTSHNKGKEFFKPNIVELCDVVESLNSSNPEHASKLHPLREFTLTHRDLIYDQRLKGFKTEFNRQYVDDKEEAVRKNLLVQHSRFTSSGNREGATFELGINYLGDRLDVELESLMGVTLSQENYQAEKFPHNRRDVEKMEPRLPEKFDWRPRGAVTPVRFQGATCASCWAFAVAGAVEGALFVKTRQLVALSEQCLVDCAHPFGGKGCRGTWPSHAYDYVQSRGLPALDEYTPYKEKVLECKDKEIPPVTRITSHVNVTQNSVPALKVAIKEHAPSVVIIDGKAKSVVFYKKGVIYDDRCAKSPKKLNHAVLAVGWGSSKGEPHFILKNSWSAAWGERGYMRVQARSNTCGVLAKPSYPRLESGDVQRLPPATSAATASPE